MRMDRAPAPPRRVSLGGTALRRWVPQFKYEYLLGQRPSAQQTSLEIADTVRHLGQSLTVELVTVRSSCPLASPVLASRHQSCGRAALLLRTCMPEETHPSSFMTFARPQEAKSHHSPACNFLGRSETAARL